MALRELRVRALVLACATAMVGASPQPTSALVEQLRDPDPAKRAAAARALADAKDVGTDEFEALRLAIQDSSVPVHEAVTWAISRHTKDLGRSFLDTPPKAQKLGKPKYPDDAFEKSIQGTVVLVILIGVDGHVAHAEVLKPIPALDAAAIACVKKWLFDPATKDGRPVASVGQAPVGFRRFAPAR